MININLIKKFLFLFPKFKKINHRIYFKYLNKNIQERLSDFILISFKSKRKIDFECFLDKIIIIISKSF